MTMGGRGEWGGGAAMAISSPSTGRVSTAPSVTCHSHLVCRGEARPVNNTWATESAMCELILVYLTGTISVLDYK